MGEKIKNPYRFMMPRLEGADLGAGAKGEKKYLELAGKGVCGFILFGGRLRDVREGTKRLQAASELPLIIASDLERGLGQQVEGGTSFPPAMAFGSAFKNGIGEDVIRRAFSAVAEEALWAGVNMIFAPVLDINSDPENPIIATRAFGEDPETVSRLGVMMIEEFQKRGVLACGKHFPGHGGTRVDSHLALPAIEKDLKGLLAFELKPFRAAIAAGVSAVMSGHLRLPLIDPSGLPATLSAKVTGILRNELGFRGLVVTDAMNMAGLSMEEGRAAALALEAGVDILLHPSAPDEMASYLKSKKNRADASFLLETMRKNLSPGPRLNEPVFAEHKDLALEIERRAVRVEGRPEITGDSVFVVLADEPGVLKPFIDELERAGRRALVNPEESFAPGHGPLAAVVHSAPRAWKPPSERLKRVIGRLSGTGASWISFGNPYLIYRERNKILAYSDSADIQRELAKRVLC
ncbi:MAG: hypothetical protein M0Z59_08235 [Nitrospiraceae bacterium]|nr:hypothetical protein [Nitrospiraceae bacterium]